MGLVRICTRGCCWHADTADTCACSHASNPFLWAAPPLCLCTRSEETAQIWANCAVSVCARAGAPV
jgi:hypothetical protein